MSLTNISSLQVLWVSSWSLLDLWCFLFVQCYIFWCYNPICRDLSNNRLSGEVPDNGSFSLFTPIRLVAKNSNLFTFTDSDMTLLKSLLLLSAVLLITWVYVVQLLGTLAQDLLHFLLLPLLFHHPQFLLQVIFQVLHIRNLNVHIVWCLIYIGTIFFTPWGIVWSHFSASKSLGLLLHFKFIDL